MIGKTFRLTLEGVDTYIDPMDEDHAHVVFSSVELHIKGDITYKGKGENDIVITRTGGTVEEPLIWSLEADVNSNEFPFLLAGAAGVEVDFTCIR